MCQSNMMTQVTALRTLEQFPKAATIFQQCYDWVQFPQQR